MLLEPASMQRPQSPCRFSLRSSRRGFRQQLLALGLLGLTLAGVPAQAAEDGETKVVAQASTGPLIEWQDEADAMASESDLYQRMRYAAQVAAAVQGSSEQSALANGLARKVDEVVATTFTRLESYPTLARVHSHEEPTWLGDRGDATAQAVLALASLERWKSDPLRRATLQKLSAGLAALQRKDRLEYPFGAHLSWDDLEPMAAVDDGSRVPSTLFQTRRAFAVEALARASQVLSDKNLLLSAEREALGMSTHLVVQGKPLEGFSPQPVFSSDSTVMIPTVRGFLALYQATDKKVYADLAALGAVGAGSSAEWKPLLEEIARTPAASLLQARPDGDPITFQVMEAEEGKVVNKAIETLGFEGPLGQRAALAAMGRENTFWMRFDVPTEDDYVFYLTYLQSDIGGGLVSVMMRIDGDKIFQVPLGDVDGRPIMRRKFVDGPRPLRAGPHSFGIRFSGLLMTKPALLDSVIVQPAVERREFTTADGDRLVVLRNVTGATARTDRAAFEPWPPKEEMVVDGDGAPAKLGHAEDRRRRKHFLTLPAYGVAILKLAPSATEAE